MYTYAFIFIQKLNGDVHICGKVYFWRVALMSGKSFMLYALLNAEP